MYLVYIGISHKVQEESVSIDLSESEIRYYEAGLLCQDKYMRWSSLIESLMHEAACTSLVLHEADSYHDEIGRSFKP